MVYCDIMNVWEKTIVDKKGKCVIPQMIREHIGIRPGYKILWISADKKKTTNNADEYLITIAIIEKK